MNLKEEEYICTLADCGSITKAAQKLYISQPALSSYINSVEKGMGVELFYRQGRQMRLTRAGELYVEKARKMLEMRESFRREIQNLTQGLEGSICIGAQSRRAPLLVTEIYSRFKARYPKVELHFDLGIRQEMVPKYLEGEIDILVLNERIEGADSVAKKLLDEKLVLVAPRKDPLMEKGVYLAEHSYRWIDLKEVEDRCFILPCQGQSLRNDCEKLLHSCGVTPASVMEIGSIEAATEMAAAGIGVSFTRESYAAQYMGTKRPAFFLVGKPPAAIPLYANYHRGLSSDPPMVFALEVIQEAAREIIAQKMD